MIKIKYRAFTLSEVLITLAVVGVLASLILPGLIKETTNKANMTLLQSTIANINDAVQQELTRKNAKYISDTDIYNNPQKFLMENFEYIKYEKVFQTKDEEGKDIDVQYKSINGDDKGGASPNGQILIKNGVYIGIITDSNTLIIDLNGPEPPNTIGVDYFAVEIAKNDDLTKGIRVGDVGAFRYDSSTDSELKADCKVGDAAKCFALVERSGYDPDYLN